jgi:cobalt-zinc-cadmium efflux system protein
MFIYWIQEEYMGHDHNHSHGELKGTKLAISIILNIFITAAQIAGGLFSGSLALLTDALHNFSDVMALIISWLANKLSGRDFTSEKTFGYKRAEILAAMINSASLIVIAFFLIKESISRFIHPEPVLSFWVIILAALSVVLNGVSVLLVKEDAEHNMNMKSAYLHLFTDMMTSIAVLAGGLIMQFTEISWVDPLLSILIAFYLIYSSLSLLFKTIKILMQFTPEGLDPHSIAEEINSVPGIRNVHHIHIWQLDEYNIHFEGHIDIANDIPLSAVQEKLEKVKEILFHQFQITHSTLQPGIECCNNADTVLSEENNEHHHH